MAGLPRLGAVFAIGLALGRLPQFCFKRPSFLNRSASLPSHARPRARLQPPRADRLARRASSSPPREMRPLPRRSPSPAPVPQAPPPTPGLPSRPRAVSSPSDATEPQSTKRKTPPPSSPIASRHSEPESPHKKSKAEHVGVEEAETGPGSSPQDPQTDGGNAVASSSAARSPKRKHEEEEAVERRQRARRSDSPAAGSSSQVPLRSHRPQTRPGATLPRRAGASLRSNGRPPRLHRLPPPPTPAHASHTAAAAAPAPDDALATDWAQLPDAFLADLAGALDARGPAGPPAGFLQPVPVNADVLDIPELADALVAPLDTPGDGPRLAGFLQRVDAPAGPADDVRVLAPPLTGQLLAELVGPFATPDDVPQFAGLLQRLGSPAPADAGDLDMLML